MFDRVERQRKKMMKKAVSITRKQMNVLLKVLSDADMPCVVWWEYDADKNTDNKFLVIHNNVYVVYDYFNELKIPDELLEDAEVKDA